MKITVNGQDTAAQAEETLTGLLAERGLDGPGVAVAVNGVVVTASAWPEVVLRPGDRIEIVTARQGG
jgi:sulfur carrier protein